MFAGFSRAVGTIATAILLTGPGLAAQDGPYRAVLEAYRKGGNLEPSMRVLENWRRDDFEKAIDRFLVGADRKQIEAAAILQLEFGLTAVKQSTASAQFHLTLGMQIIRRLTAPYRSSSQFPPDLADLATQYLAVSASAFVSINDAGLARPWVERALSIAPRSTHSAAVHTLAGIVEETATLLYNPDILHESGRKVRTAMERRRRLLQAAEIYQRAIDIEGSYAPAHVRLAHVRLRLDDLERARTAADRAMALAGDPADRYLGALALGAILERQGNLAGARAAYELALAAVPGAQSATVAVSFVDIMAGRPQDAQARIKAFVASPENDPYWWEFRNGGVYHAGLERLRARVRQ
jgi:tetratricopeptide (TPR) repeat protein